jgi:hypothetical protein
MVKKSRRARRQKKKIDGDQRRIQSTKKKNEKAKIWNPFQEGKTEGKEIQ